MTVQLLAAQQVLQKLLLIAEPGTSGSDVIPSFAVLIAAMVAMGALTALAEQRQRLLGELVAQYALQADHLRLDPCRDGGIRERRVPRPARAGARLGDHALDHDGCSVSGLTLAVLTSVGIAVALLVLEPLLLPLVLLSGIPMMLSTVLNSRRAYQFEWAMTPENRERTYLVELLTRREAAKEIRVFGAAAFLRSRYEDLTEERLRRMRVFLRERLGVALIGSIATPIGMGLALAALAYFIATGRIAVATALTAGAAMQQLSTRLFSMNVSLGLLVESGMFVDDYNSFLRLLPAVQEESGDAGLDAEACRAEASDSTASRFRGCHSSIRKPRRRSWTMCRSTLIPARWLLLSGRTGQGRRRWSS